MKTFQNQAAQGDVLFSRLVVEKGKALLVNGKGERFKGSPTDTLFAKCDGKAVPDGLREVPRVGGQLIIAHSETGHHHVFRAPGVRMFESPSDPFTCYIRLPEPAELVHLRESDTHESVLFPVGDFQIRRQRETTPEGYRLVAD